MASRSYTTYRLCDLKRKKKSANRKNRLTRIKRVDKIGETIDKPLEERENWKMRTFKSISEIKAANRQAENPPCLRL